MRARAAGQEQVRAWFLEGKLEPYHLMVELLTKQHREIEALHYAERAKCRTLLEVMQGGKSNVSSVITPDEREKERKLNAEIVLLNTQLYTERLRSQSDPVRLAQITTTLEKARLDYQTFKDAIYESYPELRMRSAGTPSFTSMDASELLSEPETALLEFVVMDEKTYLFIISSSDSNPQYGNRPRVHIKSFSIAVKRSELKVLVDTFRERVASPHLTGHQAARKLNSLLLGPASTLLADMNNLIVLPDGVLWDLPFQALRTQADRYLIEDHSISYAPSLSVLREVIKKRRKDTGNMQFQRRQDPRPHLLAFGNPQLSRGTIEQVTTIHRSEKLLPLPEAEREVIALKQLYGANSSRVYIGKAAREQNAKREIGQYRVLHFATHSILDPVNPMYSNIVLTGGDGSKEDGLLEAWEIMKLNLTADIAVLSSCETARGRIGAGEGVIGMSWAFFVAGCPTTVVSQWQVDSRSTTALMIDFHKNLWLGSKHLRKTNSRSTSSRRVTKAEALRQAMLKLMKDKRFKSPYYWAGFVVIGDGS
jgi:CHAT domain-containing protein